MTKAKHSKREKNPMWWTVFATEYLKNGENASKAYKHARPRSTQSTSEVEGCRLLKNPKVLAIIEKGRREIFAVIKMNRDEWFTLLGECARMDIRKYLKTDEEGDVHLVDDWQERHDGHALEFVEINTTTQVSGHVTRKMKIKRESKLKSLEIIGKACGYLQDKVDITSNGQTLDVLILSEE